MRKPSRYHSITRPKLRQTWNKYNFYNLTLDARITAKEPEIRGTPTFFQQKWAAKSKMRAYHGEHIPEKKWVRLFSRRLLSAVEMPPQYLATHDGSEQAAGRGSGLTSSNISASTFSKVPKLRSPQAPLRKKRPEVNDLLAQQYPKMTPYMQMTFAPLERRLDTAIFRALFASSVRQARQFVVHGAVKVNGKKMVHPSYQLNPGDMFQVEVEKVLIATGKQKVGKDLELEKQIQESIDERVAKDEGLVQRALAQERSRGADEDADLQSSSTQESENIPTTEDSSAKSQESASRWASRQEAYDKMDASDRWQYRNEQLKYLVKQVKAILKEDKKSYTTSQKVALRKLRDAAALHLEGATVEEVGVGRIKGLLSTLVESSNEGRLAFQRFLVVGDDPTADVEEVEWGSQVPSENQIATASEEAAASEEAESLAKKDTKYRVGKTLRELSPEQQEKAEKIIGDSRLTNEEIRQVGQFIMEEWHNPFNPSKPYLTPWEPRDYMSPFVFIPRYLEVNSTICAAVYLRHPVARKGMAEVPTPFNYLTNQLTHNWYLRRR